MKVTSVKVKLVASSNDRLVAFCAMTFDGELAVDNMKIIQKSATLLLVMPSRKVTDHCPKCRHSNPLVDNFCGECGAKLMPGRSNLQQGVRSLFADVAHPINPDFRKYIEQEAFAAYERATKEAQDPKHVYSA